MQFKSIRIKNFRNFEDVELSLSNKNVFFGMNDVGKTNFLYALRFVFDKEVRKNNLLDTDFYKRNTDKPIEIIVSIDISDVNDPDSEKIRAKIKGNITSGDTVIYIKLFAEYNSDDLVATPVMTWGGDIDDLGAMKIKGYFYDIDYVFNPVYVDAYVDLSSLFRKNANQLIISKSEKDRDIYSNIEKKIDEINCEISSLSGVKAFEDAITPEYQKFKSEDIEISVKSEMAIKGLHSNIVPYIKKAGDELLYPTAGEGRKKLLVYSIYDLISKEQDEKKINIFLVEEPENHLHRSMQLALSRVLFENDLYKYLFVTTHSPLILSEMDNVNLVRVYSGKKIGTKSIFYKVPQEYINKKKMLNRFLSEAIFAINVLLVEGPSEYVLFNKVLSVINPDYEVDGVYILPVNGISFDAYRDILLALGIKTIIKTDNDIKKNNWTGNYSVIGFSRVNKYSSIHKLPTSEISATSHNDVIAKQTLYDNNKKELDHIRLDDLIYLSRCSLEEDLDEVMHSELLLYLTDCNGDPVKYLQSSKNYNMVELVDKLNQDDCMKIYDSYNFECLKEAMKL